MIDDSRAVAPLEFVERVAKLTLEDFRFMFALCDMHVEAAYGDYHLTAFDVETSPRLILVARKRTPRSLRGSPARQVLPDAADGLGSHPEVRREHRLRNPTRDRWIDTQELEVALLRRRAQ